MLYSESAKYAASVESYFILHSGIILPRFCVRFLSRSFRHSYSLVCILYWLFCNYVASLLFLIYSTLKEKGGKVSRDQNRREYGLHNVLQSRSQGLSSNRPQRAVRWETLWARLNVLEMVDVVSPEFDGKTFGLTPSNLNKTMIARSEIYIYKVVHNGKTENIWRSIVMLLHSFPYASWALPSLVSIKRNLFWSKKKWLAITTNIHIHFQDFPPSNIFSRSLSRLFINQFPIFQKSFSTFRRPFQRIRKPWFQISSFSRWDLWKRGTKKKRQSADRRQTEMCSIKKHPQISESKSRTTNMESKKNKYRTQKKSTWNRGNKSTECKRQSTESHRKSRQDNYRRRKTETQMETRQDHPEGKNQIWNRGTTITECKSEFKRI